ncbi:SDR family oxidoreductase [Loktanella sp. TSTF-M6]|uniref:SDR family oxidoreductase n=1 Tax=Loktanella gaetbuli TaxID=2881335 RepID=A0ABS8BSB4_9RHOB|nr:SDR family oxidoreductase [Loktanella gaetbuli]MCB5198632.1 SDR family oxidoreductase [Loktanella gaetbuli]
MSEHYMVTGATGHLGRKVIANLRQRVPASQITAMVRSTTAKDAFEADGITARIADYHEPDSLDAALDGVTRLLLISSSDFNDRQGQHANVINAAKARGVGLIAYTSVLHASDSPLWLAADHKATEALLADSGVPHTLLRNGWYIENLLMSLPQDLTMGQHFGAARDGRFAAATRQDFAEAAAAVLADSSHDGATFELAGDTSFTLTELAQDISVQSGKPVAYVDMPEADFAAALISAGLPPAFAELLAQTDAMAADGALDDQSGDLRRLIGRPTTPLSDAVKAALAD